MNETIVRTWHRVPPPVRERVQPIVRGVKAAEHRIRNDPRVVRLALLRAMSQLPAGLATVPFAPSEMSTEERLFLYALLRGCAPKRVLEIGTSQGGSALIISSALEDNGDGLLVSIDPTPRVDIDPALFKGRMHQVQGFSPDAIAEAAAVAGAPFDFILVDGVHIYDQAKKDLLGALAYAADEAYVLLHDSFHYGVSEAIREAVVEQHRLHDCGYVCNRPRAVGELATHAGFRLLRWGPSEVDPTPLVAPLWASLGKTPPHETALLNHDIYWCQYVEPCAHCLAEGVTVRS